MFARIESERGKAGGKTKTTIHYIALSKPMTARRVLETVRLHWGVENNLHWPLDVVFHEDDARTRKNHAPQNLSFIRRIALDILKAHPDNRSISRKMKLAAWSKDFLFELFTYMQ
jgi:predicted transposase YbfD/YdcC